MRYYRSYKEKRSKIVGKIIIGIDPGKARYHAVIVNTAGIPTGKTFSFSVNYDGFRKKLCGDFYSTFFPAVFKK